METASLKNPVSATLDCIDAARRFWDVVIVGAGPTGSLAARQLTLAGANVLLVDRLSFPRWKVCGCCLNGRAVSVLEQAGVLEEVRRAGAVSLTAVQLAAIALGVALAIGQACLVGSLSGRHRSLGSARLIAVAFAIAAAIAPTTPS